MRYDAYLKIETESAYHICLKVFGFIVLKTKFVKLNTAALRIVSHLF
jgi:hypothetical protein